MRARLMVLVVAVLALAAPAGAAARSVFVKVAIDSDRLALKPEALALSVHGSLSLHKLGWRGWGGPVARGRGRARVKACVPDCNLGKVEYPRVKLRLTEVVRCQGRLIYGRLGYRLLGEIPEGVPRGGRFDMRLTDERGKPSC